MTGTTRILTAALALAAFTGPSLAANRSAEEKQVIEDFFLEKYEDMVRDFKAGQYEKVVRSANAILVLYPAFQLAEGVKDLKLKAKDRLVGRDFIHGTMEVSPVECRVGDRVTVTFTLKNVHSGRVAVHFTSPAGSPWEARNLPGTVARFALTEYGYLGGVLTDAWTQPLSNLKGVLELEPGKTWKEEFVLDTARRSPLKATKRVYRIGATIRPARITAGNKVLFRPIELAPAVLTVFPPGYRILKARPVEAVEDALSRELGINLFLAVHFVTDADYGKVLARLVKAVDEDFDNPRLRRSIVVAVGVLTGRKVPLDPVKWRRWWAAHGEELAKRRAPAGGGN